jgi:hypothetical protein
VTAEASYRAVYDHGTSNYLTQAGVSNTFSRLESVGIHGNGHMVMLEKNNLAVAALLQKWLGQPRQVKIRQADRLISKKKRRAG